MIAPARGAQRPDQDAQRNAEQEQHVDAQRRTELVNVAPPAEIDRGPRRVGSISGLPR
jgi:hypothetical protein